MERITTTELSFVPNRTTVSPLLKLFALPLLAFPPAPNIDTYGINTIPELPPQHESIYAGMFAPDGSLIKNMTKKTTNAKRVETNQIYDKDQSEQNDESLRDQRAAGIRAADGPIIYDDYDFYPDEKRMSNHEESMIVANFLRKHTPRSKNNAKLLSVEPITSNAEREKPHRIFPRSDQSPKQVVPVRPIKQTSENETIAQLPGWQKYNNGNLDRTTILPNVHFVVHDGEIAHNEVGSSSLAEAKSAPRANLLPRKRNEIIVPRRNTAVESFNFTSLLPTKDAISEQSHQKQQYKQQQQQQQQKQKQQQQKQGQQQQQQKKESNSPNAYAQPAVQNILLTP
uniref:Uncharacterized protein n=1 Tax=Elaeophora elaphi TaxID=1147741 RepID=A0A0R3RMK2_9BILA